MKMKTVPCDAYCFSEIFRGIRENPSSGLRCNIPGVGKANIITQKLALASLIKMRYQHNGAVIIFAKHK